MDVVRTCGITRGRFWAGNDTISYGRWYRVPEGTPTLPIAHSFLHPYWLEREFLVEPGEPGCPVGWSSTGIKYDKGSTPPAWKPPRGFIGSPRQWLEGSGVGVDQPLHWQAGFSTACRGLPEPQGQACATGCELCPRVSPIWVIDAPDFGSFTAGLVVKRQGCLWSSQVVAASPACPRGTAAAWQVVLESPFAVFGNGIMVTRGNNLWSYSCSGA